MLGKGYAFVTRHIRNLRGGSQPILAEASDGQLYVVKFTNNLQGANLPFNESIGSELYRAFGLAGPAWTPLVVTDSFLDRNPDCWMQTAEGCLRPASGLCFGSAYLGRDGIRLLEVLPETSFKRVRNIESLWLALMIDICARHTDNRQAIFREDIDGGLRAFFIDHGNLFGGPNGAQRPNFLASLYLDSRIYRGVSSRFVLNLQMSPRNVDFGRLWKRAQALPDDWKSASALDSFGQCIERLSSPKLLENVLCAMLDAFQRSNEFERISRLRNEKRLVFPVLYPGVQTTKMGRRPFGHSAGRRACAYGPGG